jgi:hypothetical protein
MRSSIIYILQTLLGYQIKEDEMDGVCSLHGGEAKFLQNFGWSVCREQTA